MKRRSEHGMTLIESMAALTVMMVGALGISKLYQTGYNMNSDARRMTRATAMAQDLLDNLLLLPYASLAFANACPANDNDFGDRQQQFESELFAAPLGTIADQGEATLKLLGIPVVPLDPGYERYWNVTFPLGGAANNDANNNGTPDSVRIAVIVRWQHGVGYRRVVLFGVLPNPTEQSH